MGLGAPFMPRKPLDRRDNHTLQVWGAVSALLTRSPCRASGSYITDIEKKTSKIPVFIYSLCMEEEHWTRKQFDL